MLGITELQAIDVSPAEGAKILLDLNQPIPPDFEAIADLIVDGSLLDNLFDPATALRNIGRLLAPGGRCFVCNIGTTAASYIGIPYTMFTAMWFFDYFVWNEFDYCQVYTLTYDQGRTNGVYAISYEDAAQPHRRAGNLRPIISEQETALVVYAQKGPRSTWAKSPTQHEYRNEVDWARYSRIVEGYMAQNRPYLLPGGPGPVPNPPSIPSGYMRVWEDGTTTPSG